jgi:hypothetical protein
MPRSQPLIAVLRRRAATYGILSGKKGWLVVAKLLSPGLTLRHNALRKGLIGGQPAWIAIGGLLVFKNIIRSLNARDQRIVATEVLRSGQSVRLEALRTPTKRERRAAKRQRS